jgi:hypothetical protein
LPFASERQRRFLWLVRPDIAEAWEHGKHVGKRKKPRSKALKKPRRRKNAKSTAR